MNLTLEACGDETKKPRAACQVNLASARQYFVFFVVFFSTIKGKTGF